jgi:hypothetical protein
VIVGSRVRSAPAPPCRLLTAHLCVCVCVCARAHQDSRRAMIKSYQTSGGTVLSTNWKEVAKKVCRCRCCRRRLP